MPGTELQRKDAPLTAGAKLPEAFSAVINLEAWARSLVYGEKYSEPNPDFISRMLALLTITGETVEEIFREHGVYGVQEITPDVPGGKFGPFEISDLYVAASEYETGNGTFVIVSGVRMDTGEEFKATTGATNIQATLIGLLKLGHWPIQAQFKRGDSKDKGGHYLLFLLPPD